MPPERTSFAVMPLYAIAGIGPILDPTAWAAPSADLIGDVRMRAGSSVWFGAVIRADNTPILLGADSNVQDGAIGHSDPGAPLTIGERVTVGHAAILHGCTIHDEALVGMGARILNGAVIGEGCIVGAGALVTEGKHFEPDCLIVGVPARVVRRLEPEQRAMLRASADHYRARAAHYAAELRLHG